MKDILITAVIMIAGYAFIDFLGIWILKPYYTYSDKKDTKNDE